MRHSCWRHSNKKGLFPVSDRSTIGSILTDLDLLGDLEIVGMHVHTIVILKIDIHDSYVTIHPSMKIASSLFIDR